MALVTMLLGNGVRVMDYHSDMVNYINMVFNMHLYSGLVDRWTRMALTHENKDRYLYPLLV